MSLYSVFDISGSGMTAQSIRMNAISSNIANAESASSSTGSVYRAKKPIFQTVFIEESMNLNGIEKSGAGVVVSEIKEDEAPAQMRYEPHHPLADENGYVAYPNVSVVSEMADMIAASRGFQNNVEVLNTTRQMMQKIISMGQ